MRRPTAVLALAGMLAAVLAGSAGADAHAAHGGLPLLDDAELAALAATDPAQFDTTFLNILIGHQHRAVELARMEATDGRHPRARDLMVASP